MTHDEKKKPIELDDELFDGFTLDVPEPPGIPEKKPTVKAKGKIKVPELKPEPTSAVVADADDLNDALTVHADPLRTADVPSDVRADGPLKRMMDDNFLQYASYVIRDRAIPQLEDGLKPVQRRIMWSLKENDDGKFIKVANIVGHSMQYHPHGDASIADALVVLTNKRYLIEGQGNFGNIYTGDPAAASRYIECRLSKLAREQLFNNKLTEFIPSYDGRRKEPVSLPSKLPLLLMMGAEGIAVGLSTRVLSHNFGELIEAQIAILRKEPFEIYPDFIQGGMMDISDYDRGNGRIAVRAVIESRDEHTLTIKEIPFNTTTESLIASVEDAARKKKIKIRSIQDYTAEHVDIEIKLAQGIDAARAIDSLYAFTQCETAITAHSIVISDGKPLEMTADEILRSNTANLMELLKAELLLEQERLNEEIHAKTLVQLFVEQRIYKKIEECPTYDDVKQAVFDGVNVFRDQLRRDVTEDDVEMLLNIKIKRISRFDIEKNRQQIGDMLKALEEVEKHLKRLKSYAIRFLKGLLKNYAGDFPRRTEIVKFHSIEVRQLASRELNIKYNREKGYLGFDVEGDEQLVCSNYDKLLLVWNDGCYKVVSPPDKLFVDQHLVHCAIYDRSQVFLLIYTLEQITYMKRFNFGGTILNKDYNCAAEGAAIRMFVPDAPVDLYVKYVKQKRQRIHQQLFHSLNIPQKGVKARGVQMTVKKIRSISTDKPRNWERDGGSPPTMNQMEFS